MRVALTSLRPRNARVRARSLRDGEAVTRLGMKSIRLKIIIDLNQNHALTLRDLKAMKPLIERGIAACLPDSISVDAIKVTSFKKTSSLAPERSIAPEAKMASPAASGLSFRRKPKARRH